jgi:hypothetical protein
MLHMSASSRLPLWSLLCKATRTADLKKMVLYICTFNVRTVELETHLYPSVLYSKLYM